MHDAFDVGGKNLCENVPHAFPPGSSVERFVSTQDLGNLMAYPHCRMERCQWLLKNQRYAAPAEFLQLRRK
jgi:hypothetical protein